MILHIATTGIHYTSDGGRRWRPRVPPRGWGRSSGYRSEYYPRAVQAADGTIHVFSHVGADDPYGAEDQSIVEDRFRLVTRRAVTALGPLEDEDVAHRRPRSPNTLEPEPVEAVNGPP